MKILVVYEFISAIPRRSPWRCAEHSRAPWAQRAKITALHAPDARPEHLAGVDLLVVGSPTRGFHPTEDTVAFLKSIPKAKLKGVRVAAFDTRFSIPDLQSKTVGWIVQTGGYAARHIARSLEKAGGELVAPPEGFLVIDEEGPLKEGELERAAAWAIQLINNQ